MNKKPIKYLTPEQSELLVKFITAQCEVSPPYLHATRDACMILLMLDAGLRVGEVCGLRRSDLWFGEGPVVDLTIPANIAKNEVERIVPLSDRLRQAVRQLHAHHWLTPVCSGDEHPAFCGASDYHITTRQVERIVKQITGCCLGECFHPHALRHTFATRMMHFTDIRTVQTLLGHNSITSTQIYTHVTLNDLRSAINKTNDHAYQD